MYPQQGLYRHFKGHLYQVLEIARHSETEEVLVIYQALYGERGIWARPLANFIETVEREGQRVQRFSLVDSNSESSLE